ncbi:hypothetical protein EDC01DRAFT_619551 [Geopyxis carbonaria]|nr:hypothetical protein EDC01DRAFT_619551 [Geopyxis carbonaria]
MQLQGKPYRYLVIGTGQVTPELKKGRVFVLSLTTNSSGKIQLKQRFRIDCHAPVYSVCAFGDRSIIYCDGNQLCFKTLNIENLKLEATAQIKLRSPAVKMTVSEPFIHLSTAADSLLVVKFENDTLTECFSDEVARNGLNHFNLHPDFILASDKQYGLVGLWRPGSRRSLECLTTIFETELTSSISRIRQGHCRPPWATPNNMLPGVITGPSTIVAAGIDGSFFQLTLIDQKALLLLQYVQDIVLRQDDMGVRFKSSESNRRDVRAAHINGDMLLPIEKWGAGWLRHEVAKGSQVAETQFKDAAISLLGEVDDVWESVVLYIKGLLNDAVL